MYQVQPPYEQDPHMPAAGQIGGPGQQQPQPQFTVLYLQVSNTILAAIFATIRTVQWNEARQHQLTNTVHDVETHKMPNI